MSRDSIESRKGFSHPGDVAAFPVDATTARARGQRQPIAQDLLGDCPGGPLPRDGFNRSIAHAAACEHARGEIEWPPLHDCAYDCWCVSRRWRNNCIGGDRAETFGACQQDASAVASMSNQRFIALSTGCQFTVISEQSQMSCYPGQHLVGKKRNASRAVARRIHRNHLPLQGRSAESAPSANAIRSANLVSARRCSSRVGSMTSS